MRAGLVLLCLTGCLDPVVGAQCADGTERCGGECVTIGTCTLRDAGGGDDGGGGGDGGGVDAGGGSRACDLGETRCGDECVDLDEDPDHCGGCDDACDPGQVCSDGSCESDCLPPTERCGNVCVDTQTDPDHCGSCPNECESGLCVDGECADATPGHIVVIGHDYFQSNLAMRRLVGNAVFLGLGDPVRVLVWEGDSTPVLRTRTDAAVNQVSTEIGRSWLRAAGSSPFMIPAELEGNDVFLVYAQDLADDESLTAWGEEWSIALDTFTELGGTVIVLEGVGGNDGTFQVLRPSGLFDADGRSEVVDQTLRVVSPIDGVASNVPIQYGGETHSVSFDTAESGHVVRDEGDLPVVIHKANF